MGPIRSDQWDIILTGVGKAKAAGKRLVFFITNEPGLPEAIKAIMPDALIFYRVEFGTHTKNPEESGWPHGAAWVTRLWNSSYWAIRGVDVWIFCNEWWDNKRDLAFIQRFTTFYKQVIDECLRRGVACTVGDLPVGTPGHPLEPAEAHQLPALQDLLNYCELKGMWWNQHLYDLIDEHGNLIPREYSITRYRLVKQGHPRLKIAAGEMGNYGADGIFSDKTFQTMHDFCGLIKDDGVVSGWWLLCNPDVQQNPEAFWAKDNWFPIFDQYIDWVIGH